MLHVSYHIRTAIDNCPQTRYARGNAGPGLPACRTLPALSMENRLLKTENGQLNRKEALP